MTLIASIVATRHLVMAGWTLVVVLWETTAIGVLLGAWRLAQPRASAQEQYTAGVCAFTAAVLLATVTPLALMVLAPSESVPPASFIAGPASGGLPFMPRGGGGVVIPIGPQPESRISPNGFAGAAGVIWAGGVLLLGVRLLGGGIVAASIRKRARPIVNESAQHIAERLGAELSLPGPVRLLQSESVEAPVVVGWRRPALILPTDVTDRLTPDMIDAVLAHEFAHIDRRDYVANVLQSIVELLLFFSPAIAWMSKRIREAREYCCDDVAVQRCGDPRHYIQALTTLAALATVNTVRPALGAAGPRLIVRVRRLLQEETMPRFNVIRLLALAATLLVLVFTGARVTVASATFASRFVADEKPAGARAQQTRIPFGYATEQDGSGVVVGPVVWTQDAAVPRATVRNISTEAVTGLRFIAVVEGMTSRTSVRLFTSDVISVSIAPSQTAEISPNTLSPEQLQQIAAASSDPVQVFFGLQAVTFANGTGWSITPNPAAANAPDALGVQRPEIPRDLLETSAATVANPSPVCRDEKSRTYSAGALVPLRNEPGRFARCNNGRWEESAGR